MKAIQLFLTVFDNMSRFHIICTKHRQPKLLMKKLFFVIACFLLLSAADAQITTNDSTGVPVQPAPPAIPARAKRDWKKIDLTNRSNDHFMLQFGADTWTGTNDSVAPKGFSRFFNAYIMIDKPFKTNPKFSVALGLGIGSSNMFFKNTYVDVKAKSVTLPFKHVDTVDHFKKFKLTTIFLELPVELRFSGNPEQSNKSFKFALGAKVGTLLKAYTKGKDLEDRNGNLVNNYIEKQSSKRFFNSTRLAATARIGYGIFSLYGSYQITNVLKDGAGPDVKPYSIGIAISGL